MCGIVDLQYVVKENGIEHSLKRKKNKSIPLDANVEQLVNIQQSVKRSTNVEE